MYSYLTSSLWVRIVLPVHLRVSTVRRNGNVYRYAQLVQSVRDGRGRSTTRLVKHLGRLPEAVIDALRIALRAARKGEGVVLQSEVAELVSGSTLANLRYLDLAVLIDVWRRWGLGDILDELAGPSEVHISFGDAVLALVLQRCCAPASKYAATRWVPTTALPELLGFEPSLFNNTRVHRVLDTLFDVTERLQDRLVAAYLRRGGRFRALFMDVTDTYFEGIGAPMAELTRTKTEMPNKRCLGIVLLVNEHGFPLRWQVVGGKTKDWTAMEGLLRAIGQVPWLERTLIVFDRAMGNRSTVAELKGANLHFLTAAHRNAIESYTTALPADAFADVQIEGTDASYEDDIAAVAEAARKAGFAEIHERLFVYDLGVQVPESDTPNGEPGTRSDSPRRRRRGVAHHLRRAREFAAQMQDDPQLTKAEVGRRHGISAGRVGQLLTLLQLHPEVQQRIESLGDRFPFGEEYAHSLRRRPPEEQLAALEADLRKQPEGPPTPSGQPDEPLGPLRMVAYFNPQLFVDIRRRTTDHCVQLQRRVEELNAELAQCKRSRKWGPTLRKFTRPIERLNYLDAFDVELEPITVTSATGMPMASFRGRIERKEDVWARRRQYDGFVLLLGHPELEHSGVELVNSYRGKDVVEKGFQSIKSVAELRPIYHYRDPKVQAHVTLCMLALLLMRTLEQRLRHAGLPMTASACIETLASAHLNIRSPSNGHAIYDITRPNADQRDVLTALNLTHLADDKVLRPQITPRPIAG